MAKISPLESSINKRLKSVVGKTQGAVNISKMFPPKFIQLHTDMRFRDSKDFFYRSELNIREKADFDLLENSILDSFVRENTDFSSWNEMFRAAAILIAADRIHGKPHQARTDYKDPFLNILFYLDFTIA